MIDHPAHGVAMLGGMWGTRITNKTIREGWVSSLQNILQDPLNKVGAEGSIFGADQDLLMKWVWPWARHHAMEHDSYT